MPILCLDLAAQSFRVEGGILKGGDPRFPPLKTWRRRESNPRRESAAETGQAGPDPSSARGSDSEQNDRHKLIPIHPDQLSFVDGLDVGDELAS